MSKEDSLSIALCFEKAKPLTQLKNSASRFVGLRITPRTDIFK
jgi:hypothetical protein